MKSRYFGPLFLLVVGFTLTGCYSLPDTRTYYRAYEQGPEYRIGEPEEPDIIPLYIKRF
jgi:hypothetical protein